MQAATMRNLYQRMEATEYPLVSVVMATYNGEAFLQKQLESVFQQTYPNIEIIAVDDGSTDATLSILKAHAKQHARMKLFCNEANLGYIKNFEKGCALATGAFIALCDQDDYWHPDKIKHMVQAIGTSPMVYCNSLLCDENLNSTGVYISDRAVLNPIVNCLQQAVFCRIYGHASLFTKELYQKAAPFLSVIPHDWWLCYIASLNGGINYLDEPLVYYRQHASNLYGAVGGKRRKKSKEEDLKKKRLEIINIRTRINAFTDACPAGFVKEKKVLQALAKSYSSFSLPNNVMRVYLFLRHYKLLLAVKKRSLLRKYLFCLKMFVMIK